MNSCIMERSTGEIGWIQHMYQTNCIEGLSCKQLSIIETVVILLLQDFENIKKQKENWYLQKIQNDIMR